MNRWISTNPDLIPLYAELSGYDPFSSVAQIIMEFDDGIPVAAAVYDQYNGQSIHTHLWISKYKAPSRVWWWAIHDYPFRQAMVKKCVAIINSTNWRIARLAKNMGYQYVSAIPDYYPDGDCLIYVGTEDTAKFWKRYRDGKVAPPKYDPRGAKRMPV